MTGLEAVVVGGGIIGCMIAREMAARRPDARIALIEQEAIGSGASRRSAGLHIPRGGSERVRRMTAYSERYYSDLKHACPALPIRRTEMLVVASRDRAEQLAEHYLAGALSEVAELPAAITALARGVQAWQAEGLWRAVGAQCAEVAALARQLAVHQPGLQVREGIRVSRVEPRGADVLLHLSTAETLAAARVVLAPGPWIGCPAWRELVAPLEARVKKVVALYIDRPPAEDDPVIVFEDEDAFLMPLGERNAWLFSYTCQEWDVNPDTLQAGLSARDTAEARAVLRRYAPSLEQHCAGGRLFCDAYSIDRQPLVRSLDQEGRIIFAGAANGSGYRLAPAIAAEAVDLMNGFTGGSPDAHQ